MSSSGVSSSGGTSSDGPSSENVTHWFESVAEHLGEAYLRYSFTKGTENEAGFVSELVSSLVSSDRQRSQLSILDVGCGPGRHALALGRRGYRVTGLDVSKPFVELARNHAEVADLNTVGFVLGDARSLSFDGEFDAAISLCQGGFGLTGGPQEQDRATLVASPFELDEPVLAGMAAAVRPGGLVVVSAFSAYFQLRFLEEGDQFDVALGVNEEDTSILNSEGEAKSVKLWTTCYTPRELRLLARAVGLESIEVFGATPGDYGRHEPSIDRPEFLLVARRPVS